ncbi:proline dehydrogenase [Halarchaeum rubridurum]|uniref:proline dehydrogenase n=1 Tax=Halarchaeum rubridurum TaxID=489911 RepID=A0A830FYU2_9EURY|nr:proline dehydrogenase family protein [Halarchaeum rubridurum]MBP1953622.1 proline dehydrogenase [Halarchaeum rubridurum]GGM63872.1 proline dehydrogenase [Halarchaeum rubridurum]
MIPPIADRFVAGESPATALAHAADLDDGGVNAILNLLGEHYHDRREADADADAYVSLLADVATTDLDARISVKPSQIGLGVGDDVFAENLARIVDAAAERGVFCWVDMEDHTTTDATLDAVVGTADAHPGGVGVALQANLRRTSADLERFADVPAAVRLVKGAYDEPESVAYTEKAAVNEQYRAGLDYLFAHYDDGEIAVGSHDPAMIDHAKTLAAEHDTAFEFQMLMGVREDTQFALAAEYEVAQYVPYGGKWLQYFYRRVAERRENLVFAARAVLS